MQEQHDLVSTPATQARTIAVIGGGSVGTSFIRQLAERLAARPGSAGIERVLVIEPGAHPGAGDAYQADTPSNLLNTRAASMSPLAADPQHFHRWLQKHESRWRPRFPHVEPTPDAFLPRALFGLYMGDVFDEARDLLRAHGVAVEHVAHRVSAVRRVDGRYQIHTAQGASLAADDVVLAIGNLETRAWDHLRAYPGYFNSPYPCAQLVSRIDARRSVCILGTSLSAIDAAVSLADAGHIGKIIMVSRNGRLPSVRGERTASRRARWLTRERMQSLADERGVGSMTLAELADLLMHDLEIGTDRAACLDAILRTGEGPQRYLDSEIRDASAHDRAWQSIVYSLNDAIDLIWHLLTPADKREFQARFKSLWHSYRVSFPVQNARKLQRLLHSDQLTVYGGYRDATFDEATGRFAVSVADRTSGFEATLVAHHLVNATGYTTDVEQCRSPLLRGMLVSGLLNANEFGGVDVDFDTGRAISRGGVVMPGLFVLGSLASGTYYWTNAMNVNARLADGVAQRILHDRDAAPSSRVAVADRVELDLAA